MEVQHNNTREKIINATFKILKNEGTSKATTKKIALEAGVSEVTIFRKFKNKEQLIKAVKEYHINYLFEQLDEIFEYDEDILVEEYLRDCFDKIVHLSQKNLNILKVSMDELMYVNIEERFMPKIAGNVIAKLSEYFKLQIEKKRIRNVTAEVLALNVFSIIFESIILWKIYDETPRYDIDVYADEFLDIFMNGISLGGQ